MLLDHQCKSRQLGPLKRNGRGMAIIEQRRCRPAPSAQEQTGHDRSGIGQPRNRMGWDLSHKMRQSISRDTQHGMAWQWDLRKAVRTRNWAVVRMKSQVAVKQDNCRSFASFWRLFLKVVSGHDQARIWLARCLKYGSLAGCWLAGDQLTEELEEIGSQPAPELASLLSPPATQAIC